MAGLGSGQSVWPYLAVTSGRLLNAVLFLIYVFIISYLAAKNAFAQSNSLYHDKRFWLFLAVVVLLSPVIAAMGQTTLFQLHIGVALAAMVLAFGLYKLLEALVD